MRSRRLVALAALVAAAAAASVLLLPHDPHRLGELVAQAGPFAPLLFLLVWVPGTCALVPGTLLCALGGLLFGPVGVALSLLGSPLGALAAFALARVAGPAGIQERLPRRVRAATERLERSGARGVFVLRMTPGMPVCAMNYACGLTRVRARDFLLGSAVGAAPRVVLYGGLGGIVGHLPFLH